MMRWAAIVLCSLWLAACAHVIDDSSRSQDVQEVQSLAERQADAWNAHDARAYAALFTDDAQVVNVLGWRWGSRAELETKLGRAFAWVFAESALTIEDVDVAFLADDVAVAHVRWSMSGARSPTGLLSDAPQHGVQTLVVRRQADGWRIAHFQNTNSLPERDFPVAAPAP